MAFLLRDLALSSRADGGGVHIPTEPHLYGTYKEEERAFGLAHDLEANYRPEFLPNR